jgi:hypothetical protein
MDKEFIERLVVTLILLSIMAFINLICIWKG